MSNNPYYEAISKMEQAGVDADYINGWACGYLLSPKREEQRLTEAYEAGYAKGLEKDPSGFEAWVKN